MDKKKILKELKYIDNKIELKGLKIFYPVLKRQCSDVAKFVRVHGMDQAKIALPLIVKQDDMLNAMVKYYSEGGLIYAKWQYTKLYEGYKSLGGNIAKWLTPWLKEIQMYVLSNIGGMITNINDTTLMYIRDMLDRGNREGWSADKTARMINHETGGEVSKRRGLIIARTEGTRVAAKGHKIASESWQRETGSNQYKEWIPIIDNRTRPDHKEMDQKPPIPANELFNVNGIPMDAPGDPTAPPEETINCRCRVIYLSERMVNGR